MLRDLIKKRIEELTAQHDHYRELSGDPAHHAGTFPTQADIYSSCAANIWDTITELQRLLDQDDELITKAAGNTEYVIPMNEQEHMPPFQKSYPFYGNDKDWVEGNHSTSQPNIHDAVRNYIEDTDAPGGHGGC